MKTKTTITARIALVALLFGTPLSAVASSWSPTLLVNTESFQIIDDGDGTTDIELRFGDSANERIYWDVSAARFDFTDDVYIEGNLQVTGTASGQIIHADQTLSSSGSLVWEGTASGAALWVSTFEGAGLTDCDAASSKVIWDATTKKFTCGTDDTGSAGISFGEASTWFVNDDGDTMTGALIINDESNAQAALEVQGTASGRIVRAQDALNSSGTLTVDGEALFRDNVTFGSTVKLNNVTYTFPFSDGTSSGKVLKTDGAGNLVWSTDTDTDTNTTYTAGNGLNLNSTTFQLNATVTGTLLQASTTLASSGTLVVEGATTLNGATTINNTLGVTGTISTNSNLTINADNGDADAVLTFGNDAGAKAITYSNANTRFEFNDDIKTTGNLSGSTLTIDGNVTIRGQTYAFPTNSGGSGYVLRTDGAGNLAWAADAGPGSGDILFLQPDYANAIYFASGSTTIGTLAMSGSTFDNENYYLWNSTKGTLQDYWISVRVRVPETFTAWDPVKPIEFRYKTADGTAATNHVTVRLKDTAGSFVALTGAQGLASATWATAAITGPQSSGTYTPGGYITAFVKLATTSSGWASAGFLEFNWETTAP